MTPVERINAPALTESDRQTIDNMLITMPKICELMLQRLRQRRYPMSYTGAWMLMYREAEVWLATLESMKDAV